MEDLWHAAALRLLSEFIASKRCRIQLNRAKTVRQSGRILPHRDPNETRLGSRKPLELNDVLQSGGTLPDEKKYFQIH